MADVKEIPAKYLPVDLSRNRRWTPSCGRSSWGCANDWDQSGWCQMAWPGGLGQFKSWINQEVKGGKLTQEMAKEITVRFATFESTMATNLGTALMRPRAW